MAATELKWSLSQSKALLSSLMVLLYLHTAAGTLPICCCEYSCLSIITFCACVYMSFCTWRRNVRLGWMFGRGGRVRISQRKQPSWRNSRWAHYWHHNGGCSLEPGWEGCWLVLVWREKHPSQLNSGEGPRPRGISCSRRESDLLYRTMSLMQY